MVYRFDGSESASGTAPADADLFLMHDDSATDSGNPKDKIADCTAAQLAAYVATKIGVGGTNNMDATIDPTAGDDSSAGYEIGSMWYNQTTDTLWIAESVGVGSASWQNVSGAVTEKALDDLWQAAATPALATNDKFPFADVSGTDTLGTATAPDICSTGGALLKDGTTDLTGDLVINERADHADTPTAGKGQLWVRNDTPNVLVFTDDAGTDTVLGGGATEKGIEDIIEGKTPAAPATADEFVFRDVSGTDTLGCATAAQIVTQGNSDLGIVPQKRIETTVDPTVNDDSGSGYAVNDLWTNTTDDTSWICVDATATAAVWKPIALTKTGTAAPAVAPDFVGQVFLDTTNENIYIGIDTVNAADFLQVNGGGAGGDLWSDVVDADIVPDADGTRDLGADATRFAQAYIDELHSTGGLLVTEAADHTNTPAAGKGEFWVRNDTPCVPVFTDDAGTDHVLNAGGDAWSDAVDADIVPDADGTRDLGADATRFAQAYVDELHSTGGLLVTESADHTNTPAAGKGEFWVRNDTPCTPVFTDDAGVDHDLYAGEWFMVTGDGLSATSADKPLFMVVPYDCTLKEITWGPHRSMGADATNYWTLMPKRRDGGGDVDLLDAAFSTAGGINEDTSYDLGTITTNGTDAQLSKGDVLLVSYTAVGSPPSWFGNSQCYAIHLEPR